MNKKNMILGVASALFLACATPNKINQIAGAPAPYGATPTDLQVKWNQLEYYAFAHFNMNTFTDREWGYGDEDPKKFNPTEFDAEQWARIVKDAGMKGIILTAKHHDGFCLWPSAYTEHSIKNSPYKNGKGDIVKEVADACKKYGLKFGVYLSPWDRNHPGYATAEYVEYFHNQLKELMTNYGNIYEVWFDGANGGDGYYGGARETRKIDSKTYYEWDKVTEIVRKHQPKAIIWGDAVDARWVGNEKGIAAVTNWSTLDRDSIIPGKDNRRFLVNGIKGGKDWSPAEADVSTRPGWYYHKNQDNQVKTLPHLLDIYYKSVGRNANLLLNIPIDTRGLIHENDEKQLMRLGEKLKEDFAHPVLKSVKIEVSNIRNNNKAFSPKNLLDNDLDTYWALDDNKKTGFVIFKFKEPQTFNRFLAQENIRLGQRVEAFSIEAQIDGKWQKIGEGTTIGYKRILRFRSVTATALRFNIESSLATPVISTVQLYNAPTLLTTPHIDRNRNGEVTLSADDLGVDIYYLVLPENQNISNSDFDKNAKLYQSPFQLKQGIVLAKSVDAKTKKSSDIINRRFSFAKKDFKIISPKEQDRMQRMVDDNEQSWWASPVAEVPEIVLDLGNLQNVKELIYTPPTGSGVLGIVKKYKVETSTDGKNWTPVAQGEFDNIENNPITQNIVFKNALKTRFLKLKALQTLDGKQRLGAAEVGVIVE
ncbi:alpha-L-fucosidase [Ornithobacterium rhinotracheale]|uniref:alpha-L-fucosidase n=1 Tax=Ornithobacterium rhinotracheale TaxID=28251 RepID=UPI003FA42A81